MSVSLDLTCILTLLIISLSTCISASTSSLCLDALPSLSLRSLWCYFFSLASWAFRSSHFSTDSALSFFSSSIQAKRRPLDYSESDAISSSSAILLSLSPSSSYKAYFSSCSPVTSVSSPLRLFSLLLSYVCKSFFALSSSFSLE